MITAFLAGVAAGYGIAIPVGVVSILIVETGLRRGFRLAFAAGAGAASADGAYALVAAAFGTALATILAPFEVPLRAIAVVVLVAIAARGLLALRDPAVAGPGAPAGVKVAPGAPSAGAAGMVDQAGAGGPAGLAEGTGTGEMPPGIEPTERSGSAVRTYGVFLGITLLNPVTVTYFAALILGLTATGSGIAEKLAFVTGAFLASLSWQTLVAAVGAFLHRRLSSRLRAAVILLGNAIVLAFAAVIAVGLIA